VVLYGCKNWTIKKAEHQRIDALVLEKTLESPLDCKEIQPSHPLSSSSPLAFNLSQHQTLLSNLLQAASQPICLPLTCHYTLWDPLCLPAFISSLFPVLGFHPQIPHSNTHIQFKLGLLHAVCL